MTKKMNEGLHGRKRNALTAERMPSHLHSPAHTQASKYSKKTADRNMMKKQVPPGFWNTHTHTEREREAMKRQREDKTQSKSKPQSEEARRRGVERRERGQTSILSARMKMKSATTALE